MSKPSHRMLGDMKRKLHQHVRDQRLDRWLARGAVIVIVGVQTVIVNDLSFGPWWLGPSVEIALLIPCRSEQHGRSAPRQELKRKMSGVMSVPGGNGCVASPS